MGQFDDNHDIPPDEIEYEPVLDEDPPLLFRCASCN